MGVIGIFGFVLSTLLERLERTLAAGTGGSNRSADESVPARSSAGRVDALGGRHRDAWLSFAGRWASSSPGRPSPGAGR